MDEVDVAVVVSTDDDPDHEVRDRETNILHKMKVVMMRVEIRPKVKEKIDHHVEDLLPDGTEDSGEDQGIVK